MDENAAMIKSEKAFSDGIQEDDIIDSEISSN